MSEKTRDYLELKSDIGDAYLTFSRDFGIGRRNTHHGVVALVYNEYYDWLVSPPDRIMFLTLMIIIYGDWYETSANFRQELSELINEHGLATLLADFEPGELEEIKIDLKVLGYLAEPGS